MTGEAHPRLKDIELGKSYILGVIYDDESLTLEMDFNLCDAHPRYQAPENEEGCYRKGFIKFSDFEDFRLRKAKVEDGRATDYSDIYTATIEGNYAYISSGWGEIELTAGSIQIAVD